MPGRDRTGPMGQGPLTGGSFGFCAGPGYRAHGMGFRGRGRGLGRGGGGDFGLGPRARLCWWRPSETGAKEWLHEQQEWLQQELDFVKKQLADSDE